MVTVVVEYADHSDLVRMPAAKYAAFVYCMNGTNVEHRCYVLSNSDHLYACEVPR